MIWVIKGSDKRIQDLNDMVSYITFGDSYLYLYPIYSYI